MSLFENEEYQWRETFFILFELANRPSGEAVQRAVRAIDPRYIVSNVRSDQDGLLDSLTVTSPDDYSAMDISLVQGDEVTEQLAELTDELLKSAVSADEKHQIQQLAKCRGRFDIYHFEQLVFVGREHEDEPDDFMDPGAVLTVMGTIAQLCQGTPVDPQANALL